MPIPKTKHQQDQSLHLTTSVDSEGILFEHADVDSWLRADADGDHVIFDSSDMDGKPRLDTDAVEQLIDWLTERWREGTKT